MDKVCAGYQIDVDSAMECVEKWKNEKENRTFWEYKYKSLFPHGSDPLIPPIEKVMKKEDIPQTVDVPVYLRQSHKTPDGKSKEPFSLMRLILMDLSIKRNDAKALMKKCHNSGDADGEQRYNAIQNTYKVCSNSFYGATGSETFSTYDPDIAGATTWTSRQCIRELTDVIESDVLYVDEKFLNDNEIQWMTLAGLSEEILSVEGPLDHVPPNIRRRVSLARLYGDDGKPRQDVTYYIIHKARGSLVYQDTDSNYYLCRAVQQYFLLCDEDGANIRRCDPDIIGQMMEAMVTMNQLLEKFVGLTINNSPLGVGFEGAFVVARHLNRKKKYMGKKAADDDGNLFSVKLDPRAYDENGFLLPDFEKYWKGKGYLVPRGDGSYINIDNELLLNERMNYYDFVASQGIKCTGIDIVRRDQYKFINYFHLSVIKNDLRVCRYEPGDRKWTPLDIKTKMKDVVQNCMELLLSTFKAYADIAVGVKAIPPIKFRLSDFTKTVAYNGSTNASRSIHERLTREGKDKYLADLGSNYTFVIVATKETDSMIQKAMAGTAKLTDLKWTVDELMDDVRKLIPDGETASPERLEAMCISRLYVKYYMSKLASALALYIVGEDDEDAAVMRQIDEGQLSGAESKKHIDKMKEKVAKELIQIYYPIDKGTKSKNKKYDPMTGGAEVKVEAERLSEEIPRLYTELTGKVLDRTPLVSDLHALAASTRVEYAKMTSMLETTTSLMAFVESNRSGMTPQIALTGREGSYIWGKSGGTIEGLTELRNYYIKRVACLEQIAREADFDIRL